MHERQQELVKIVDKLCKDIKQLTNTELNTKKQCMELEKALDELTAIGKLSLHN